MSEKVFSQWDIPDWPTKNRDERIEFMRIADGELRALLKDHSTKAETIQADHRLPAEGRVKERELLASATREKLGQIRLKYVETGRELVDSAYEKALYSSSVDVAGWRGMAILQHILGLPETERFSAVARALKDGDKEFLAVALSAPKSVAALPGTMRRDVAQFVNPVEYTMARHLEDVQEHVESAARIVSGRIARDGEAPAVPELAPRAAQNLDEAAEAIAETIE